MAPPNRKRPPRPGDPPADGPLRRKPPTEVDLPEVDLPFDTSDLDLPFDTGEEELPFGAFGDEDLPFETAELDLPFDTAEVTPLRLDDPSPQRVAQYPVGRGLKKSDQVPTEVMQVPGELSQGFTPKVEQSLRPVFLYVDRGPGAGQLVPVRQGRLVVGRSSSSDLRLQHPSISRRHAEVTRTGERFFVKDLSSQNGTFVNKARLLAEREIFPGDTLGLGTAVLKLRGPMSEAGLEKTQAGRRRRGRWLALFACAVGIGMAGILVSTLLRPGPPADGERRLSPGPLGFPAQADHAPVQPGPELRPAPLPARAEPEQRPALAVARPEPRQSAPTAAARPEPRHPSSATSARSEPRRPAPAMASRSQPKPAAEPSRNAPRPARHLPVAHRQATESPPPAPGGDPANQDALQAYRDGELSDALHGAGGALLASLTHFQAEYDAGRRALAAHDLATANRHFRRALAIDRGIAHGAGTFHGILVHELEELKLLQADDARSGPAEPEAAPPSTAPSRSAIDDAFGD
jgi:hypothetical protein